MELRHSGSRGLMLVPFREWAGMFREHQNHFYFWQITLNILLFIPFGFMTAVNLYLYRKNSTLPIWLTVVLLGFAFSLLIEVFQFITGRGYTEVDDIINNTFGAFIGYWGYRCFLKKYKNE
jgi:glycopeptide antibiotics resistance protein